MKLRAHQILDYILVMREIERIKRLLESKGSARQELETVYSKNLVMSELNTYNQSLGRDLLQGLQLGVMTVLNTPELVDQAVSSFRNISGLSPLPAVPASLLDQTGSLLLQNGRVLFSNL